MGNSFEWSAPAAQFEIFGVPCEIEVGDAETVDRLTASGRKMQRFDAAGADKKTALAMSHELRGVVRSVIGEEAAEKVFEGRKPNVAMEASMVAYIFEQVNDAAAAANGALKESIARLAAIGKPIGDED